MTVKRSGLGRNLSALLGNPPTSGAFNNENTGNMLALTAIQPGKYQPRGDFDDALLAELAASIKQQGLLQPIVVRPLDRPGQYEILAGERRWRACQLAALTEIPVIIKAVDDQTAMAIALVENLQREDLNAMDQARAMQRLTQEFDLTHQQIADLLNKSRTAVSNFLRLLTLHPAVKRLLENADIDMGHARALLMLNEDQQREVAQLVVARELSVRETEKLVQRIKKGVNTEKNTDKTETQPTCYQENIHRLSKKLQTKIALKPAKNGRGTLVIHYDNNENLAKMLSILETERQ